VVGIKNGEECEMEETGRSLNVQQAIFNTEINLARISMAVNYFARVLRRRINRNSAGVNNGNGAAILFLSDDFIELMRYYMLTVPFSHDVRDELEILVRGDGKYNHLNMFRQNGDTGVFWNGFEDFLVFKAARAFNVEKGRLCWGYSSQGRNFTELQFYDSTDEKIKHWHDCETTMFNVYKLGVAGNLLENDDVVLDNNRTWRCGSCGYQVRAVNCGDGFRKKLEAILNG